MINVVQIVSSIEDEAAGTSYCVHRLSNSLAALGHRTTLMSLGFPGELVSGSLFRKRYSRSPTHPSFLAKLGFSGTLRDAVYNSARSADILHTHGLWMMPNVYPAWAAKAYRKPLVMSPHGMLSTAALQYSRLKKRAFWIAIQGSAARAATCLHATSILEYEQIRAFGLSQPIAIIPNGIDIELAFPDCIPAESITRPYTVLYLGRLHPIKRLEVLLEAWAAIEPKFSDWKLTIRGPGEQQYIDQLRGRIRALRLKSCEILDPVYGHDKASVYRAASVYVLPSATENFGMTVAESLASCTPVISTKGTPWRGLVENRCGWWIDHGVEPLIASLSEALSLSAEERSIMGIRGQKWMERDFSWSGITKQMEDVYLWLAASNKRSGPPSCVRID